MLKASEMSNDQLVEFTRACIKSPVRSVPPQISDMLAKRLFIANETIRELNKDRGNLAESLSRLNNGLQNLIPKSQAE